MDVTQGAQSWCHPIILQVFLQINRFRSELPMYHPSMVIPLVKPTDSSLIINLWVSRLIDQIWRPEYSYKKVGVMLSEITPNTHKHMKQKCKSPAYTTEWTEVPKSF